MLLGLGEGHELRAAPGSGCVSGPPAWRLAPRRAPRCAGARGQRPSLGGTLDGVTELLVCHLGQVEYSEAVALQERIRAARPRRRAARTCCCCSSTRRSTRAAGARTRPSCRWARTGTARRASTSSKTDRGGKLTYHGPGQLVGYPIMRIDDVVAYLRTMEEAIVAALAEEGIAAGPREGLTGVWVRGPQDRLDRRPRLARRDDPRLRDQRRQRPAAVRVGRAVRARGRTHDLGDQGDRPGRAPRLLPPPHGARVLREPSGAASGS